MSTRPCDNLCQTAINKYIFFVTITSDSIWDQLFVSSWHSSWIRSCPVTYIQRSLHPALEFHLSLIYQLSNNLSKKSFDHEWQNWPCRLNSWVCLKEYCFSKWIPAYFMSVVMTSFSNRFLNYDVMNSVTVNEIQLLWWNEQNLFFFFFKIQIRPNLRSNYSNHTR